MCHNCMDVGGRHETLGPEKDSFVTPRNSSGQSLSIFPPSFLTPDDPTPPFGKVDEISTGLWKELRP